MRCLSKSIGRVYKSDILKAVRRIVKRKRTIRILLAKPGLDGHDQGVKILALGLRDEGMEVIYTGLRQTPEEIAETIRLARSLPIDEAVFNITTPLPGTELFERFRDQINSPVEEMDYYRVYPWRAGEGLSPGRIRRLRMWAYLSFYLHPGRIGTLASQLSNAGGIKRTLLKLRRL